MSMFHRLDIVSCERETRDAVVLGLGVPEPHREAFRFLPGQYLTLRSHVGGRELRRAYSICSAPGDGVLRVAIKHLAGGEFSSWANTELRAGHSIEAMPPAGLFRAALDDAEKHHVGFAAGSGITPILSILKATLAADPTNRFTLFYGNRASSSVLFGNELSALKDRYLDRLTLCFVFSREPQDIDLFNGRIDGAKCAQLLRHWVDPADIDVAYLCGPQSMMDGVAATLQAHGVQRTRIRRELFDAGVPAARPRIAPAKEDAASCAVTVIQDGRRRAFRIDDRTRSLLDAALHQGIELPYSCKRGVCSTCRCKVIAGEVDRDAHFALEDYEIARGFILCCRSYAVGDALVLDFDQDT